MVRLALARRLFRVKASMRSGGRALAARARSVMRLYRRFSTLAALVLSALLASWLGPVAVLRYQRLSLERDAASAALDSVVPECAVLEVAIRRYAEQLEEHWRSVCEIQERQLRIDESRLQRNVQLLERDQAEVDRDAEQVTRQLTEAKARFETAAGAYEVWLMKTSAALARLRPDDAVEIDAVSRHARRRLQRCRATLRSMELTNLTAARIREHQLRETFRRHAAGALTGRAYEEALADAAAVTRKPRSVEPSALFVRVTQLADRLRSSE
jgi:exonuclease VII large subunit